MICKLPFLSCSKDHTLAIVPWVCMVVWRCFTISSILEVLSTQSRLGEVLSRQAAYVLSFLVKSDRIDLGLMQTDGSCLTLLTLAYSGIGEKHWLFLCYYYYFLFSKVSVEKNVLGFRKKSGSHGCTLQSGFALKHFLGFGSEDAWLKPASSAKCRALKHRGSRTCMRKHEHGLLMFILVASGTNDSYQYNTSTCSW